MKRELMGWQTYHLQIIVPRFRQITMPAPHHSIFDSLDALPDAQATVSKQRFSSRADEGGGIKGSQLTQVHLDTWPLNGSSSSSSA